MRTEYVATVEGSPITCTVYGGEIHISIGSDGQMSRVAEMTLVIDEDNAAVLLPQLEEAYRRVSGR
ncbi:hypothetical protein [Actinokineospora sp. NBRC 105648]|uniref:hypothetical protein n=1 Tax=Actinokineospora sp. NBRC 105648 TaxID=3032206 RepID=UPI00255528D0|nr:hypothetical protein [Actinokineospora sp. NBRC 105648]